MKKPCKCCEMGSYECQVPMPINGRRQEIDLCVADMVAAMNAANIITDASCCGHGYLPPTIITEKDEWWVKLTREQAIEVCEKYKDMHYEEN